MPSLAILVSAVLVLSCGQTDRQTESQKADQRYTHATTIGVSKNERLPVVTDVMIVKKSICWQSHSMPQ